ncbi:MAG: nuclear transport factor 2 family protein [Hyphomicrobiaceae bacterium]|nr:nuclear transport factor 2 family protein [Hyphomicrobiaceae bacterium]
MSMPASERDALFKAFGRAFFKRDVDALYETVTPDFAWHTRDEAGNGAIVTGREAVGEQLSKRSDKLENIRFEDVVYHHAPDATFMTFRLTATEKGSGARHEEVGVERYTFRDGRIAIKDVYRKPSAG